MKKSKKIISWKNVILIIAGALFSFCILPVGCTLESGTVYSKNYSRWRFSKLRVGMSQQQVEMIMGPPLKKVSWPGTSTDDTVEEMWAYTWQATSTDSYYRKWLFFSGGHISEIVNDIWID